MKDKNKFYPLDGERLIGQELTKVSDDANIDITNRRNEITKILYENSTDDSECIKIKFENIQNVIDLLDNLYD